MKQKLSLEMKENGKISINVPGVGDGKVELTPGIDHSVKFRRLHADCLDLIKIEKQSRTEHTKTYVPGVIEPSFGIGRIL